MSRITKSVVAKGETREMSVDWDNLNSDPMADLSELAKIMTDDIGMTPREQWEFWLNLGLKNASNVEQSIFLILDDHMCNYEKGSRYRVDSRSGQTLRFFFERAFKEEENRHRVIPAIIDRYCLRILQSGYSTEDIASLLEVLREDFGIE